MASTNMFLSAVVTGATSGIGLRVARLLARGGAELTVTGRDERRLDETARDLGCRALPLNLNDPLSVNAFLRDLGGDRFDCFVVNAGSPEKDPADQARQTAGALTVLAGAAGLVADGGVLGVTNTLFTQYPDEAIPPEFLAYVRGKRELTVRLAEIAAGHPRLRAVDFALDFVAGTRGLDAIMSPAGAAQYVDAMRAMTTDGKLTSADEAGMFIYDRLCDPPGDGVRLGIDGSTSRLDAPAAG
jgi:NAD(P)-dependent dehydrogenase (short-subunit alcohol dehydrogenase family)